QEDVARAGGELPEDGPQLEAGAETSGLSVVGGHHGHDYEVEHGGDCHEQQPDECHHGRYRWCGSRQAGAELADSGASTEGHGESAFDVEFHKVLRYGRGPYVKPRSPYGLHGSMRSTVGRYARFGREDKSHSHRKICGLEAIRSERDDDCF